MFDLLVRFCGLLFIAIGIALFSAAVYFTVKDRNKPWNRWK